MYKEPEPTPEPTEEPTPSPTETPFTGECEFDDDCDTDEICEENYCKYKAPEPEEEKTCDEGFVYDDDLSMCVPEQIDTDKECDPPCVDGEMCAAGYCVPAF